MRNPTLDDYPGSAPVAADPLSGATTSPGSNIDDSVDVLRIVAVFTAEWRVFLLTTAIVFALGAAWVIHLPSRFVANAVLLPKAPAPAMGGLSAVLDGFRPASPYTTLLTSRNLLDDVIRRAGLNAVFGTQSMEAARGTLSGMTQIFPGADGTYNILVRDRNATRAARIANTYIDALRSVQENMAEQQAQMQRRFFENQLNHEREALAAAEEDFQRAQESSGIIAADTQTQIGLSTIAGTRSQITGLEVRLSALLQSETEQNPEIKILRSQIAQLQAQERSQESATGSGSATGAAPSAGRMPRVNLEIARKQREVQYHQTLVNSLASQYENLRMGEGSMSESFDVIDRAIVPEFPTWPPRRLYFLLALAAGLLTGLVAAGLAVALRRLFNDPQQRDNLRLIRASVHRR